jgi:hypothetical protein
MTKNSLANSKSVFVAIYFTLLLSGCANIAFDGAMICLPVSEFSIPGISTLTPSSPQTSIVGIPTIRQSFNLSAVTASLTPASSAGLSARVRYLILSPITRESATMLRSADGTLPNIQSVRSLGFLSQMIYFIYGTTQTIAAYSSQATSGILQNQTLSVLPADLRPTISNKSLVLEANGQIDVAPFLSSGTLNLGIDMSLDTLHSHAPTSAWGMRASLCVQPNQLRSTP